MLSFFKRLREAWSDYLARLAKSNKESFGSGRVDCCGLGKASASRKHG